MKAINESTLQGIANAIRGKSGSTDSILVSDFASAIESIPSGGSGLPSTMHTGTFTLSSDVRADNTIEINHGIDKPLVCALIVAEDINSALNNKATMMIVPYAISYATVSHTTSVRTLRGLSATLHWANENGIATLSCSGTQVASYYWRSNVSYRWFAWFEEG